MECGESEIPRPATAPGRRRQAAVLVEGMRPRHWVKNTFVFAALFFAAETDDPVAWARTLVVFAAFCLASGGAYLLNDARDADEDRRNARTARRPVARGDLGPRAATVAAGAAGVAALALAAALNWQTLLVVGGFIALQIAYTTLLKHLLFVDVLAIAAGFVLRAGGGGVAIGVTVSAWLLLATGLLAVFLGLTKRRSEAVAVAGGIEGRSVVAPRGDAIDHYSPALLDELIAVVTPAILVVYCLYAVIGASSDVMLVTVPFVLYGIFRMLLLVHHDPTANDEPTVVVWRDRPLLACVVLWAVASAVIAAVTR